MSSNPSAGFVPRVRQPLLVIRLRGTQAEMGEQHGRLLLDSGGELESAVDFYRDLPERLLFGAVSGGVVHPVAARVAGAAKHVLLGRLMQQRPPEYLDRSRAFMRALGRPSDEARLLTVMDLFQNLVGLAGRFRLGPFSRRAMAAAVPACSTLAVWDGASRDGVVRHARNFDFPGIGVWDCAPAVVFCEPDRGLRYGFVTTRGADVPGVTAFNEAGITVTAHTRFHRDVTFDGAAIIDVGHDIVRRADSLNEAIRVVQERRIASTWGLAVSSSRERSAVVIETTANEVEVVAPRAPGRDHLSCANRYRHPRTRSGEVAASPAWAIHSDGRQTRFGELVDRARAQGGLDAELLQRALDDRIDPADPEHPRGSGAVLAQPCTVQSVVAEPEARAIHVSVGAVPTSRGPFVRVPWSWDGGVGAEEVASPPVAGALDIAERAYDRFVEATRIATEEHHWPAAGAAMEQAVALSPDDASYRFLAGALRLREGRAACALGHFEHGLRCERIPFRRGQLMLWGARAADGAGRSARAVWLREQLLATTEPKLAGHRQEARKEARKPKPRSWKRMEVNFFLGDAQ